MVLQVEGPSLSKTRLACGLAVLYRQRLAEFVLMRGTDTSDLLGSFEQVSSVRNDTLVRWSCNVEQVAE